MKGDQGQPNPRTGEPWEMWPCGCRTKPPARKPGVNASLTPEVTAAWRAELAAQRKGNRE
jgi:hypothetical protein